VIKNYFSAEIINNLSLRSSSFISVKCFNISSEGIGSLTVLNIRTFKSFNRTRPFIISRTEIYIITLVLLHNSQIRNYFTPYTSTNYLEPFNLSNLLIIMMKFKGLFKVIPFYIYLDNFVFTYFCPALGTTCSGKC